MRVGYFPPLLIRITFRGNREEEVEVHLLRSMAARQDPHLIIAPIIDYNQNSTKIGLNKVPVHLYR